MGTLLVTSDDRDPGIRVILDGSLGGIPGTPRREQAASDRHHERFNHDPHEFTGNYPTPGGYSMVNLAYLRWYEGVGGRSYDLPL
jgi:hypothetical protein